MTARQPAGGSTLERALSALEKMERKLAAVERAQQEPLAIVGMACRFPGGVVNPADFWQMLHAGTDAVVEVPANRWNHGSNPQHPAARWAGLINDVDQFDGPFFGLARNEVVDMDPQHRFLLEVAWEALEDSGIPPERLAGTKTGVFIGISSRDYATLLASGATSARPYVSTGNAGSFAAGRIAHLLGLQGPCLSIDTACSSSLVALHLACQSLRNGECDMAIVGGVNLLLAPEVSGMLASLQILSPDGRCRTFDARANGYVRSEAAGILVL
ncbi:MAG TPA: polyketide synthase, partial [Polyangium sp.]|nr:polyketide synthase [Polyangium sp.]